MGDRPKHLVVGLQKLLMVSLKEKRMEQARSMMQSSPENRALWEIRLNGGDGVKAWLQAVGVNDALRLHPKEAAIAIALAIGHAPAGSAGRTCSCGATFDARGVHLLTCPNGGGPTIRHNKLRDVLADCALAASAKVCCEVPIGPPQQGGNPRLADVVAYAPFLGSRPVAMDVRVIHNATDSRIAACPDPLRLLDTKAREKVVRFRQMAEERGMQFTPCIADVFGSLHADFAVVLNKLADNAEVPPEFPDWVPSRKASYWWQAISVAIQRGNALCALGHLAKSTGPREVRTISGRLTYIRSTTAF